MPSPSRSSTLTPSSHPIPGTDLHVAVKLLRVVKSFEMKTRVRGFGGNANAKVNVHNGEELGDDEIDGDDIKSLQKLAKDAKKKVERCLSWRTTEPTKAGGRENRRKARRCCRSLPCRGGCGFRRRRDMQGIHFRRLLRAFRIRKGSASAISEFQGPFGLSDLPALAANNAHFLQCKSEASVGHLNLKQLGRSLAFVDDSLAVLHHLRHQRAEQDEESKESSQYDETFAANLEHLLLSVQHTLIETFVGRLAKLVIANASTWYAEAKRKGKLGGQQWCSEFSNNQRPLSTTWPWSIRPSLAVIWGVCWMFYNNSRHRRSISSQEQQQQYSPQESQHVPQRSFLDDPDNASFFNAIRPEDGACKYTQWLRPLRPRVEPDHSLTAEEADLAYGRQALESQAMGQMEQIDEMSPAEFEDILAESARVDISSVLRGDEESDDVGRNASGSGSGGALAEAAPNQTSGNRPPSLVTPSATRFPGAGSDSSSPTARTIGDPFLPTGTQLRQHAGAHQYNVASPSSPNASSRHSPTDEFWPQAATTAQGLGPWQQHILQHQNQDFRALTATHAVSPQPSRRVRGDGHMIGPTLVPRIRVIPEQSESGRILVTEAQAAAPQAYDLYPTTASYATSPQAAPSPQNDPNIFRAPHPPRGDTSTTFLHRQHHAFHDQTMGLQVTPPLMQHSEHPRPESSAHEEPASKRRRVSMASEHASLPSTNMGDEPEESTSPAPSESVSPHGFSPRRGYTFKRDGDPPRNAEGKMICTVDPSCRNLTFDRKCEWGKHMDKHERPYRCERPECSKLQGFTYSGGLLRHQREVHNMHGGTGKRLFCPEPNCKRHTGSGFTRKENLQEHMRRVHRRTESVSEASTTATAPVTKTEEDVEGFSASEKDATAGAAAGGFDSLLSPVKRKRDEDALKTERAGNEEDSDDPREEIRRLRRELTDRDEKIKSQDERLERLEKLLLSDRG